MNLCSGCKRDFTGVGPFDKHQRSHRDKTGKLIVTCIPPADLDMEQNEQGRWGYPGTFGKSKAYVPANERPAHEFEVECSECGTIFERPRRRGRPPTKCEDCR